MVNYENNDYMDMPSNATIPTQNWVMKTREIPNDWEFMPIPTHKYGWTKTTDLYLKTYTRDPLYTIFGGWTFSKSPRMEFKSKEYTPLEIVNALIRTYNHQTIHHPVYTLLDTVVWMYDGISLHQTKFESSKHNVTIAHAWDDRHARESRATIKYATLKKWYDELATTNPNLSMVDILKGYDLYLKDTTKDRHKPSHFVKCYQSVVLQCMTNRLEDKQQMYEDRKKTAIQV